MNVTNPAKKSFLWSVEHADEDQRNDPIDFIPSRVLEGVGTSRFTRDSENEVGTGRDGRDSPENKGFARPDLLEEGRDGRDSPIDSVHAHGELTARLQKGKPSAPSPWGFTPDERRRRLDRLRQGTEQVQPLPFSAPALEVPDLPGVPLDWTAGVYKLQTIPARCDIHPFRWERFRYDALRLLHEQGAELRALGWDALDLFGLHRIAPDRRSDAMGVAWLMRELVVTAITQEAVSLTTCNGVVSRATRLGRQARMEAVLAWELSAVASQRA